MPDLLDVLGAPAGEEFTSLRGQAARTVLLTAVLRHAERHDADHPGQWSPAVQQIAAAHAPAAQEGRRWQAGVAPLAGHLSALWYGRHAVAGSPELAPALAGVIDAVWPRR